MDRNVPIFFFVPVKTNHEMLFIEFCALILFCFIQFNNSKICLREILLINAMHLNYFVCLCLETSSPTVTESFEYIAVWSNFWILRIEHPAIIVLIINSESHIERNVHTSIQRLIAKKIYFLGLGNHKMYKFSNMSISKIWFKTKTFSTIHQGELVWCGHHKTLFYIMELLLK